MAKLDILAPFILSFEGKFVNHPADPGGATNRGVTLSTWRQVGYDKDGDGDIDVADLKLITEADAINRVMRPHYWNRYQADKIKSQSVANILVDWLWASGKPAITKVQQALGVTVDGVVGDKTIQAINSQEPRAFFAKLHDMRVKFIDAVIANRPTSAVFRAGWMRRLDYIRFGALVHNTTPSPTTVTFNDIQP